MGTPLQRQATIALSHRLRDLLPRGPRPLVDDRGSVLDFRDNLLPHLADDDVDQVRSWFEQGAGDELAPRPGLRPKAHTAHSSATLVANTFGPYVRRTRDLTIGGLTGFEALRLEARHHPLPEHLDGVAVDTRREANLDVELIGPGVVVGIESKLTEHLVPSPLDAWRWEYDRTATLSPLPTQWRDAVRRRRSGSRTPRFLNTTQLLKHALALCRSAQAGAFGPDPVDLHLIYLFWEPVDGASIDEVAEHRAETAAFATEVEGPGLSFQALTHGDLWGAWENDPESRHWTVTHARGLRERYEVGVGPSRLEPDRDPSTADSVSA